MHGLTVGSLATKTGNSAQRRRRVNGTIEPLSPGYVSPASAEEKGSTHAERMEDLGEEFGRQ